MSQADDVFMRQFGAILGFLVVFAFAVYFVASAVGDESHAKLISGPDAVNARIAPVGMVATADTQASLPAKKAVAAAPAKPAAPADGQAVYKSACFACHAAGVANAPKLTDKAAWEVRAKIGLDGLVQSAIKGKNAMPPKGGRMDLDDGAIKAAIQYMLKEAGVSAG